MSRVKSRIPLSFASVGLAILLAGPSAPQASQQLEQELPVVSGAAVPMYPTVARVAKIQGIVRIRVDTDGNKITSSKVESGHPMLAEAAQNTIRTWKFAEHKPTTFVVTFKYEIEDETVCRIDNGTVVLQMPSDVQIKVKGIRTCDPVQSGSPFVTLTVMHNGKAVRTPYEITLSFDERTISVPVSDGRFEVPHEVFDTKSVTFTTIVGNDRIRVANIYGGKFGLDHWTLTLEDRRFSDEFERAIPKGTDARSSCILTFESETTEGTVLFQTACRTKIK